MKRKNNIFITLCALPALILVGIFMVYPTLSIFSMSLFKWGGLSPDKTFVGLNNFKILFRDQNFLKAFQNQLVLIILVTLVTIVLALVFAAILVKEKVKGQNFFRIVFYVPNILSVTVIASIFSAIYDPSQGIANAFFRLFNANHKNIQFLGNPDIVVYAIAFALIWQAIGYYMVMYMAAMSNIPIQLYEAADIEGASRLHQFFNITIPLIWDNIRTTLTFFIVSNINLSFLFTKIMTNGGPYGSSQTFLGYLYNQAYDNSVFGYGMAIATVVFVFTFILVGFINFATKRKTLQY